MLKSRHVFIDTQAFHRYKFRFRHPVLVRLSEIGASGRLNLLLTEPVEGEIGAHIREQLLDAHKALAKFHASAGPVEAAISLDSLHSIEKLGEESFVAIGAKAWGEYRKKACITTLQATNIDVQLLLKMYFKGDSPFGPGKKKSEFPDAISALTLSHWMRENDSGIYVISDDPDIVAWCKKEVGAIHLASIADLINLYNEEEVALTKLVQRLVVNQRERFVSALTESFQNGGFIYTDSGDAEISDLTVEMVNINDINVIDVKSDRATVSMDVELIFSANISGPDYSNAVWDSEDKRYIFISDFSFSHNFHETYEASATFRFDADREEVIELEEVTINDGQDIELGIDDGYPYK